MSASAPAPRAQRGILACAGGTLAPHAPPAPSRRAHRARAGARVRLKGLGCAARPATVQRDPHAGGARARPDAEGGSTCSRDPPSHAPHARRARGGRARAPRWGLGGGIQRTVGIDPVLWAPRPSRVLGWHSCVRRASRSGIRGLGRRESHFGGRHRTSCSRVRCWRGGAPFWALQRGTRHPDIGSRPLGAVFVRFRARSCIDLPPRRAFLVSRPAALCPPHRGERSDQIEAAAATRDPRRPKRLVVGSQGPGDRPAAA